MAKVARLIDAIKPSKYLLKLEPDLENFNFSGHETIEFEHTKSATTLTLHSLELEVLTASLKSGTLRLSPTKTTYHKDDQTVTLHFGETIPAGPATLEIEFAGKLRDDLHGFYRSHYEVNGEPHDLATTQFEATHAREAFIVIDEPSAKAVFEITLIVPSDLTAISNTDITDEKKRSDGKKVVTFTPTPKMSPYLAAFLVGQFEAVETTSSGGTVVRVYTTPGKKHQASFALDVAAKTLDFYTEYFGVSYPLPKLDMIAIPDFAHGAMENWGAVTYRETAILVDAKNSALANKQMVAYVIAHELAHQWFGNLVTMKWWTDLWLNESFATWVGWSAMDHLFPDWQIWTQFVAGDYLDARELDSLANTHPIEVEVEDPAQISEIFDAISYEKGASVIRMLQNYLGEADFKTGLHDYLEEFKYGNAVTNDLWRHLGAASGKPVQKLMSAWTSQPGFPVVNLSSTGQKVSLEQRRFYANPKTIAKDSAVWPIPIQILTDSGSSSSSLLDTATADFPLPAAAKWLRINPNQTGFYVTNYSETDLINLEAPLAAAVLEPTDRLGIISDVWALVKAGQLSSDRALALSRSLRNETNFAVWMSLLSGIGELFVITEPNDLYKKLEQFDLWLIEPTLDRLGWDGQPGESHFDQLLRPAILGLAGRLGDEAVIDEARQRFSKHANGTPIAPDLRMAVYGAVARHGGQKEYEQIKVMFTEATMQEEQRRLLRAMSQFKDPGLINRTLEFVISDAVRSQDSIMGVIQVLSNRDARQLAWQFIQKQWPLFIKRYAHDHMLTYISDSLGNVFAGEAMAREIEQFFEKNAVPSIQRSVRQCLERIRLHADWFARDEAKIRDFLESAKLD